MSFRWNYLKYFPRSRWVHTLCINLPPSWSSLNSRPLRAAFCCFLHAALSHYCSGMHMITMSVFLSGSSASDSLNITAPDPLYEWLIGRSQQLLLIIFRAVLWVCYCFLWSLAVGWVHSWMSASPGETAIRAPEQLFRYLAVPLDPTGTRMCSNGALQ